MDDRLFWICLLTCAGGIATFANIYFENSRSKKLFFGFFILLCTCTGAYFVYRKAVEDKLSSDADKNRKTVAVAPFPTPAPKPIPKPRPRQPNSPKSEIPNEGSPNPEVNSGRTHIQLTNTIFHEQQNASDHFAVHLEFKNNTEVQARMAMRMEMDFRLDRDVAPLGVPAFEQQLLSGRLPSPQAIYNTGEFWDSGPLSSLSEEVRNLTLQPADLQGYYSGQGKLYAYGIFVYQWNGALHFTNFCVEQRVKENPKFCSTHNNEG